MTVKVAIIGAGPSGFYAAEALLRAGNDSEIDFIESLPTPYGLVRGGVAPDHQSTKGVIRAYEKTASDSRVSYFGNVRVGQDVSVSELRKLYDAVVIAIGAPLDRSLDVSGGDKLGVYGSAQFVGWYNGHPDHQDLDPDLNCSGVAIIGHGNVALDIARVLVKTPREMAESDLPANAARAIHGAPISDVYLFGRRGPLEARFTNVELRELGTLEDCVPVVDPAQLPAEPPAEATGRQARLGKKNLATLKDFVALPRGEKRKRLHLVFFAKPVEVIGEGRVSALRLERTRLQSGAAVGTGEFFDIPCGLVIASIGTRTKPLAGVPFNAAKGIVPSDDGRVGPGLYVVGWAKRGPAGVIGTNKPDGAQVAQQIAEDITDGGKPGRAGLQAHLTAKGAAWVDFDDWKRIDEAEIDSAGPCAPRRKLIRIKDMMSVLEQSPDAKPRGSEA